MSYRSIQRFSPVLLLLVLSACITVNTPPSRTPPTQQQGQVLMPNNLPPSVAGYQLAPNHWGDVARIRAEAQRLGAQVAEGKLTKVQAAQYLNKFRLGLVGSNPVDDNMYEIYQRAAVDSQRGVIDSAQSKAAIESALRGWQQRWASMNNKPNNPAFTNFLMEVMGLQVLK